MILRNLQLNESDRRELKTKIFASDRKAPRSTLTLNKISTSNDEFDERDNDGERSQSPSPAERGGLNCDFLLRPTNSEITIGEARIEELTIERCRLDLEGARVLGKALRTRSSNNSAISTLKSLKMVNLAFWDEDNDACEILLPLLEGMAEAGKRGGCLESLEFRRIHVPSSKALRSRFFSALGQCKNLRSLKLSDCDIRSEDASELAEALASLAGTLETLDLSRNHINGAGLKTLIQKSLLRQKRLRKLILSHNPIGDDGAVHLSKFLSSSGTRIECLLLIDCDMWSSGCDALGRSLRDFDSLRELVVGGEWEYHLQAVADSLRTNVTLKQLLVVSQQHYTDNNNKHKKRIEYYLALNRAHRRISIDENLSFKLWPTILEKAQDKNESADLWYHLLRRRPELVATEWN
eukprot:CAMPEP_0116079588 /NCGR_PEP_ID=MMETSP0327-20121206/1223_1 /TAXON_ID=44447 /ORGANISM="Pseudo-nitzschia delicatissima, Strain B596" /LENGTH=408 /DNA_ID=CAMNT_0003570225 /DNA_START=244 /DNA_END=1470 /DNA_ORIENTATION=+